MQATRAATRICVLALAAALIAPTAVLAATWPGSMAALGDSLTVGQGAGSGGSWATGTNAAVDSHLLRLDAEAPGVSASNFAQAGKKVSALNGQAQRAVAAHAEYVTIMIGTNDVCGDLTSLATFRDQFSAAMTTLTGGLPAARIFVVSIPDWGHLFDVFHANAAVVATWKSDKRCPNFLTTHAAAAAQRLIDFNAAMSQICALHGSQCTFDGGAVHDYAFTAADYSTSDYFHFSASGQAAVARITFPLAFAQPVTPPPPPPPATPCGLPESYAGTLAGTGAVAVLPAGGSYVTSVKAKQIGCLQGPAAANFDLYLQKLDSGTWKTVAKSRGRSSTEKVSYSAKPGTYRWQVQSSSGSGSFSFGLTRAA
jgi:lysophospholipase L1-like esterase